MSSQSTAQMEILRKKELEKKNDELEHLNSPVPYILACKSQNLRQNCAPKVRGRLIPGS